MNMSIDKLIDEYYHIPYVTHEKGETENYIYIKRGTSMWDAVVSLAYKLYNTYPYINGQNKIMLMAGTPKKELVLNDDSLLNYGTEVNTRRFVSDFHMEDIDGIYGSSSYTLNSVCMPFLSPVIFIDFIRLFTIPLNETVSYKSSLL